MFAETTANTTLTLLKNTGNIPDTTLSLLKSNCHPLGTAQTFLTAICATGLESAALRIPKSPLT